MGIVLTSIEVFLVLGLQSRGFRKLEALVAVAIYGEAGVTRLLTLSQVVLSLQLPFAVSPLVRLTGSEAWMGRFANGPVAATVAWALKAGLVGLNGLLLMGLSQ